MQSRLLFLPKSQERTTLPASQPVQPWAPVSRGSPEGDRTYRRGTTTRSLPPRGLCPESLWQENNGDGEKLENWVPRGLFL